MLGCDVFEGPPSPLPTPIRSWFRNDLLISSLMLGSAVVPTEFVMNNTVLMLGVLEPQTFVFTSDGTIIFRTDVENITQPNLIPNIASIAEAEEELFRILQATWTCEASNELGTARISYTVRACGELVSQSDSWDQTGLISGFYLGWSKCAISGRGNAWVQGGASAWAPYYALMADECTRTIHLLSSGSTQSTSRAFYEQVPVCIRYNSWEL